MTKAIGSIKIKNAAQLAAIFGAQLAKAILQTGSREKASHVRTRPSSVRFYAEKPAYYLNDGEVLDFYAVDVVAQQIIGAHFAGSSDTTAHHAGEQLGEGGAAPGDAVIAITYYWDGQKTAWSIDVISSHVNQLTAQPAIAGMLAA